MAITPAMLADFARRYTAAWCSQNAGEVASFFSADGSLSVNGATPAVGRVAITAVAQGFMTAFPDLKVFMDGLDANGDHAVYRWTLTGTNTGPGGTGRAVRIRGYEEWRMGADGLIAESQGQFDAAEYERQLREDSALRILDEAAVRARLTMPLLIETMERALVEFSARRVQQPVRTIMRMDSGLFGLMPTFVPALPALGAKLVTVCPGNLARGIGTHQAIIVMLNAATGVPEAVVDGRYITEARTAAVSAVSAKLLARKDSRVLAIIGSGSQARSHLEALRCVRDLREVRAWSPNKERLGKFAEETGVHAAKRAAEAVRGADIVVTVTASPTPVVRNDWVKDGAHVIAVGSCLPTQRELDPLLVKRARLFVDSREAALKEAGDVVMGIAEGLWTASHIIDELGELPARKSENEITVFKSLGLAVEDIYAAHLALNTPPRQ